MKGLSVRAPWPWAMFHLGKDIENRDWATSFRGRVWIHQSKFWRLAEVMDDWEAMAYMAQKPLAFLPHEPMLRNRCGCIVGSVEIVDCVSHSSSRWFAGDYGFVLRDPIPLAVCVPCKGALGFFEIPKGLNLPPFSASQSGHGSSSPS